MMTLFLPWFPIILGVGVGSRLLGRTRGFALGVLCALFWITLARASQGAALWDQPWATITLIAGALAIVAMGGWAGESGQAELGAVLAGAAGNPPGGDAGQRLAALERLSDMMAQFDDWLSEHRDDGNPWPAFDEFIRSALRQCCDVTHVRPYRLTSGDAELVALREVESLVDLKPLPARKGIVGHVLTSGLSYLAGDPAQGPLVKELAEESAERFAWCFPVRCGGRTLGIVTVARLQHPLERSLPLLRAAERMVCQCWCTLEEVTRGRAAGNDDPVSGLPTRETFFRAAEPGADESYACGEPIAVVVVALEGLREMNDAGRWEAADQLVREVGAVLRRKLRLDDRLGRFDGSRFVVVLRRVDSELAALIVRQLLNQLAVVCDDESRWRTPIKVRCGLAGSGTEQPALRELLSRALLACRRAREEGRALYSDLEASLAVGVAGGRA